MKEGASRYNIRLTASLPFWRETAESEIPKKLRV